MQLKFLIEGEEEVGSEGVEEFIAQEAARLACDVVVISDSSQFGPGQPAITYGLKGIAYFELRLTGPGRICIRARLAVRSPIRSTAATRLMASLVDEAGRIQVPGFYDDVVPLTKRERQQFAALPFDEAAFMQKIGVTRSDRRARLHDARAALGASDLRHQRHLGRLPGRRGQDGAARRRPA